jgi:hypothetical protein
VILLHIKIVIGRLLVVNSKTNQIFKTEPSYRS